MMRRQKMRMLGMSGLILLLAACARLQTATPQEADATAPGAGTTGTAAGNSTQQYNTALSTPQVDFAAPGQAPNDPSAAPKTAPAPLALELYGQLPATASPRSGNSDGQDNFCQMTFASEGADFDPVVDPGGREIIFASTRQRRTADLYVQKIGGAAVTQLTSSNGNSVMPAISPDAKKVAFCSDRGGKWDIYLMDKSGGPAVQLTNDAGQNIHPSFSPDGRHLVYCSYSSPATGWELVVIDLDNPAALHHIGSGLFPNWAPVGDKILFQKPRERGTRWFSIWTIEYAGGEGTRPTAVAVSANAAAINPQWSPDGRQIVFATVFDPPGTPGNRGVAPGTPANSAARPSQADIWVMNADGTGRTNLTRSRFLNVQPTWGRDGSVYFVSDRAQGGLENIWSIRTSAPGAMLPAAAVAPARQTNIGVTAEVPTP
jgi:Tol biopolymer transport system component